VNEKSQGRRGKIVYSVEGKRVKSIRNNERGDRTAEEHGETERLFREK
jgi:hypothetical protein